MATGYSAPVTLTLPGSLAIAGEAVFNSGLPLLLEIGGSGSVYMSWVTPLGDYGSEINGVTSGLFQVKVPNPNVTAVSFKVMGGSRVVVYVPGK